MSKTLLEKHFFQNETIPITSLVGLANDVIKTIKKEQAEKFNIFKELTILYKQVFKKPLTKEEEEYNSKPHNLDVMEEILNGIKLSFGYLLIQNFSNSIFSSIYNRLYNHIPYILGYTGVTYFGHTLVSKAVEIVLAKINITEEKKKILESWLKVVGRLALGLMPRVSSTDEGIAYQYPSSKGKFETYGKQSYIKIEDEGYSIEALHHRNVTIPEGEYLADDIYSYKLDGIHTLSEHHVRIFVTGKNGQRIPVCFIKKIDGANVFIKVDSPDEILVSRWEKYLNLKEQVPDIVETQKQEDPKKDDHFFTLSNVDIKNSLVEYGIKFVTLFPLTSLIWSNTQLDSLSFVSKLLPMTFLNIFSLLPRVYAENTQPTNLPFYENAVILKEDSVFYHVNGINVISLSGTHKEMGLQYGKALKFQLIKTLNILKHFFIGKHNIPYKKLVEKADLFYNRYSYSYQLFLHGIAEGSGLSLDDCKILNGMETLNSLIAKRPPVPQCAFISVPPERTKYNFTLIGRNYDFPPPFDECAKYLTVTILKDQNKVPTALISMPGQIYCPTCVNSKGLFIELNNGMPSGGYYTDTNRQSLLIALLEIIQNSNDFSQMEMQLQAIQSDYSLIINTANEKNTKSFEFSSTLGMKLFNPESKLPFVSTNFYLNNTWNDIPSPTDNSAWSGVTRRNNLLALSNSNLKYDLKSFMKDMDKKIEEGGAVWNLTIYQIIFDPKNLMLYLKITKNQEGWKAIPLSFFFSENVKQKSTDSFLFQYQSHGLYGMCKTKLSLPGMENEKICQLEDEEKNHEIQFN